MAKSKKEVPKEKTFVEMAETIVEALENTESVLNTFRNIASFYFRKRIHMSDTELKAMLDADTEAFIKTRSEYECMFYFLERRGLMEDFSKFRAEIFKKLVPKEGKEENDE